MTTIYRRRGSVARNQTIMNTMNAVLIAILNEDRLIIVLIYGSIIVISETYEPPRKSSEVIADISTIEQYSPRKNQDEWCC